MAVTILSTSTTESDYRQIVPLSGVDYVMRLRWNGRDYRWYMSLETVAGEKVFSGVRVVANYPLTYSGRDLPWPPGVLMAYSEEDDADPGLDELGERVRLMYFEGFEDD
jgi:hypothetical protein